MKTRTCPLVYPTDQAIRLIWAWLITAVILLVATQSRGALLFTEDYHATYGDGTALGANQAAGGYSAKWPNGNSTGTGNPICTSAGALTYGPLQPISGSASYGFQCATAGSRDQATGFASQSGTGNSVYLSFLIQVTAATPTERILIGFRNSTGGGTLLPAVGINAARQLVLFKSNAAAPTPTAALAQNQTYLVVMRYKFLSTADECAMWLNPVTGGADEASAGVTPIITTSGSDQSGLLSLRIESDPDASGPLYLDEIRVGQSWEEVTPLGGPVIGSKLGFSPQPANAAPGATMATVAVQVQNPSGIAAASNGVPVTLTMTSGSGTLSGTLTQDTDATGKAMFNDLSIDTVGIKQLTVAASGIGTGLAGAVSSTFSIIAQPVGVKLAFSQQPVDGVVNATMTGVTIQIQDVNSLPVASNAVPITLTLTSGSGTLLGTVTRNTDGTGKAVFNDLSIDTDGTGKQLTASATGGLGDGLADALSSTFNIYLTPQGVKLAFTTQPASTAVGATMNDIVVQVQDNTSAAVASNGVPVMLTLTLGTGTVGGTTTLNTDGTGKATFAGLSIDTVGAAKQFTATASGSGAGLASAPSSIFAITGPSVSGAPVITQAVRTASSMILAGTNGVPSGQYKVLNATNPSQPMATWTAIQTNTFSGNGTFISTNTVSPGSPMGFFRLLSESGGELPDFGHYGFAGVNSSGNPYNLTGGTNGSFPQDNIVFATDFASLGAALSNPAPLVILVEGEIYMRTNGNFYVQANKTIQGIGTNATLVGCLGLYGNASGGHPTACSNIIIRNITLRNPDQFGEDDGIVMKYGAHHIWIDHCTFHDVYDGTVDITRESDFVTVSWCKFFYNSVNSHGDTVNLLGGSDSDSSDIGKLHVTFHHNWWGPLCRERMPSVRFGRVHVFNNYFNSVGNHYCVRARLFSEVLVENNYFDNVFNPWELATSSLQSSNALLRAVGNITNNCTFSTTHYNPTLPNSGVVLLVPGTDIMTIGVNELGHDDQNPFPYPYSLDTAIEVPTMVQAHAGAGKGPFAP